MNKKIIKAMIKCTDALNKDHDPSYVLNDPALSKIGQDKFKGATSFLKFKKGCPKKKAIKKVNKTCTWEFKTSDWSYRTTCGKKAFIPAYVMGHNKFKYCPFCGEKAEIILRKHKDD